MDDYTVEYENSRNPFNHSIIERTERRTYPNGDVYEQTTSISAEGVRQVAWSGAQQEKYRDQALAELSALWRCPDGFAAREHSFETNGYLFDWKAAERGEEEPIFQLFGWDHGGGVGLCVSDIAWTPSRGWQ